MDRINMALIRVQNVRQQGQGMVEYGLIVGLVSLAAVVALTAIGTDVSTIFTNIGTKLTAVPA